jgi:cytoskeletal protein RodZ
MNISPGDSDGLGDRLRAERPRLDTDGQDRVRETVVDRLTARPRSSRRTSVAVAALLALGLTFTGGGAAVAISGFAADTTAVNAQYSTPTPVTPTPTSTVDSNVGVQGETDTSTTTTPTTTTPSDSSLQGESDELTNPTLAEAPNQVAAANANESLPFTGFAAIPIIVIGALLIAAGALLRRRTSTGTR